MRKRSNPYTGKGTSTEFLDGKPTFANEESKSLVAVVPTDGKGKHGNKLFDDTVLGNVSIHSCSLVPKK